MNRCGGQKRNGEGCTVSVEAPLRWCWWHDPANAEERKRAASKGGRAKANPLTKELHALLEDLTRRVVDGTLPTSRGAVANQLVHTRIRLLDFERRVRELDQVEERLARLEREGGLGRGALGWGA